MEYDWKPGDELICVDASPVMGLFGLITPDLEENKTYVLLGWIYVESHVENKWDWFVQVLPNDLEMHAGFRPERFRKPIIDETPIEVSREIEHVG